MIGAVKQKYSHAVIRVCKDEGCRVSNKSLRDYVILEGEALVQNKKICDCIFFARLDGLVVCVVELKAGEVSHAKDVVKKLANGAAAALDIIRKCGGKGGRFELLAFVLSGGMSSSAYRVLTRHCVKVGGECYPIATGRCGAALADLVRRCR